MISVKMNLKILVTVLTGCLLVATTNSYAISNKGSANQAKAGLMKLRLEMKKLKRLLSKSGVRSALIKAASSAPDLQDSDDDGLPDVIENVEGTDSCDIDSDDDGLSDGDEGHAGSDPKDEHSGQVEVHAVISAISSDTVTIDGYIFTVNSETKFKGHSELSQFSVGEKVEAKGKIINSVLVLRGMSLDD